MNKIIISASTFYDAAQMYERVFSDTETINGKVDLFTAVEIRERNYKSSLEDLDTTEFEKDLKDYEERLLKLRHDEIEEVNCTDVQKQLRSLAIEYLVEKIDTVTRTINLSKSCIESRLSDYNHFKGRLERAEALLETISIVK